MSYCWICRKKIKAGIVLCKDCKEIYDSINLNKYPFKQKEESPYLLLVLALIRLCSRNTKDDRCYGCIIEPYCYVGLRLDKRQKVRLLALIKKHNLLVGRKVEKDVA